jgi:hypothetical protein
LERDPDVELLFSEIRRVPDEFLHP